MKNEVNKSDILSLHFSFIIFHFLFFFSFLKRSILSTDIEHQGGDFRFGDYVCPDTGGILDRLCLTSSEEMCSQGAIGLQQLWRCHSCWPILARCKGGALPVLESTSAVAGISLPTSANRS